MGLDFGLNAPCVGIGLESFISTPQAKFWAVGLVWVWNIGVGGIRGWWKTVEKPHLHKYDKMVQ